MNKVIFINWFQTLSYQPIWHHLETQNHSLFQFLQEHVLDTPLKNDWLTGRVSFCNIWHHLNTYGIPKEVIQTQTMNWMSNITVEAELLSLIQQVRRYGYKVVIATNHVDIFGNYLYPYLHLEDYFDDYISSAEVGFLKTQQDENKNYPFFVAYLKKHQLTYQDCILIDKAKDVTDIYHHLGMTTFTTTHTQETIDILNSFLK